MLNPLTEKSVDVKTPTSPTRRPWMDGIQPSPSLKHYLFATFPLLSHTEWIVGLKLMRQSHEPFEPDRFFRVPQMRPSMSSLMNGCLILTHCKGNHSAAITSLIGKAVLLWPSSCLVSVKGFANNGAVCHTLTKTLSAFCGYWLFAVQKIIPLRPGLISQIQEKVLFLQEGAINTANNR